MSVISRQKYATHWDKTRRLMSCSCCGKTCIETKCPYSINYTETNKNNLEYLYKDGDAVKLKQNHKYFTQYLIQMGVTKIKNTYFVVWTTHEMVIDIITFDKELRESMKSNFEMFYKDFCLNSFFSEYGDICLLNLLLIRKLFFFA